MQVGVEGCVRALWTQLGSSRLNSRGQWVWKTVSKVYGDVRVSDTSREYVPSHSAELRSSGGWSVGWSQRGWRVLMTWCACFACRYSIVGLEALQMVGG